MELLVNRIAKRETYTIGRMYIMEKIPKQQAMPPGMELPKVFGDDKPPEIRHPVACDKEGWRWRYICDTMEPRWRDLLHGEEKVRGLTAIPEGHYEIEMTWSPTFNRFLPLLKDVPNFMGVRIHAGNLPKHTKGCILVGENRKVGRLYDSLFWLRHVINFICGAREVWITVR